MSDQLSTVPTSGETTDFNPDFLQRMLGWQDPKSKIQYNGWGVPALTGASSLFNSWVGLKQLDLSKQALAEQKRQFGMNWEAQKASTNRELYDRQQRRIAFGDPNAQDTASYMAQWGIK